MQHIFCVLVSTKTPGWEAQLIIWLEGDNHWLYRRCRARLGNWFDAEDATQDVTIKVIYSIHSFEGRSSLKTWVSRIADNHCYSLIKQRSARAVTEHLAQIILLYEHDRQSASLGLVTNEDDIHVQSTLQGLTSVNREILKLRYYEALSLSEMANALGLSLSATKMRLYRAINVFRVKHPDCPQ